MPSPALPLLGETLKNEAFIPEEVWANPVQSTPFESVDLSDGTVLVARRAVANTSHRCNLCMRSEDTQFVLTGGPSTLGEGEREYRLCPIVMHRKQNHNVGPYDCHSPEGKTVYWFVQPPSSAMSPASSNNQVQLSLF